MKKIDVTQSVMKDVAVYERNGISKWLMYFIVSVSFITVVCIAGFILIVRELLVKHAFDLFELFTQDPEIIADFWKEVLLTFWDEIPQNLLSIVFIFSIALVIIFIGTRTKRSQIRKKMKQLDKYS